MLLSNNPNSDRRSAAILIVEDDVLTRLAISDYLQECGFKTFEASSAAEALEIIAGSLSLIDLVFTDVGLHGVMDGIGLARWIELNHPNLPVLLTSGDFNKAAKAKEFCANESFFEKPYNFERLVVHIRATLLNNKTAANSAPS